jgi:hypothetical protein
MWEQRSEQNIYPQCHGPSTAGKAALMPLLKKPFKPAPLSMTAKKHFVHAQVACCYFSEKRPLHYDNIQSKFQFSPLSEAYY